MDLLNKFSYLFTLLLAIIQFTPSLSVSEIPESSFIPLNPHEISSFELTKTSPEIYFSFQNNYEDSDIIINLKIGKGFNSVGYVYNSYDSIITDEKGEYINYIKKLRIIAKKD